MNLLHARHATSLLTYADLKILVDPVFSEKEEYPPVLCTPNKRKNPIVDLKTPIDKLLDCDIILSTHIHQDHFDKKAALLLEKSRTLICQPEDAKTFESYGFFNILQADDSLKYGNIKIKRVSAQHGEGETLDRMGPASGYILESEDEPAVYLTGDTVFNESVRKNIENYDPEILIINAGSPKFLNSSHIVMNILDLEKTIRINPKLTFVIVHLDTYNHCIEKREDIREYFSAERLDNLGADKFYIPEDNEFLEFKKESH